MHSTDNVWATVYRILHTASPGCASEWNYKNICINIPLVSAWNKWLQKSVLKGVLYSSLAILPIIFSHSLVIPSPWPWFISHPASLSHTRDDREWPFTFPFPPIPTWWIDIPFHSHSQAIVNRCGIKIFGVSDTRLRSGTTNTRYALSQCDDFSH